MSSRTWVGLLVITFAGLVRLPHADVSWFGFDQINFVAEGRHILAGDWNVSGPLASGFNILGPLYSFLVAGLLWIGGDAVFLTFSNALCEVAAAWLVYDTARRLSGQAAGIAAGVVYATAPMLIISTRLIWNPSLLPAAVALGYWLVVRYLERPSTGRLVAVALACGLTLTLHATAIFPIAAWALIVLFGRRPSFKQMAVAIAIGLLPLTPLLFRLLSGTHHLNPQGPPLAANDVLASLAGIGRLTLSFPVGAYSEHWSAMPSATVLHLDAAMAVVGLAIGWSRKDSYRALWVGLTFALGAHLTAAVVYSGPLAWYYFTGIVAPVCLCVGHAVGALPRVGARAAAAAVVALAMTHVVFVGAFDGRAIEMGFLRFETDRLTLRLPPTNPNYGATVRETKRIGDALRHTFPDAVTAMRASHGARAELWRETGAEFMPRSAASRDDWRSEFVLMGPGPAVLRPDAHLAGARACVFDRPQMSWKVIPDEPPAGWQTAAFADDRWYPIDMPRRWPGLLTAAPSTPGSWRTPRQSLRGRLAVNRAEGPHLVVVSLHSYGNSQHWINRFAVNGADIPATKSRMMQSSMFRNEEWLFDLTGRLHQGENLVAVGLDGQAPVFDVDVFELPCVDREWYNAEP